MSNIDGPIADLEGVDKMDALEHITKWGLANDPDKTNLLWKGSFWPQIQFVRDKIAGLLCEPVDHSMGEYEKIVRVCGTHHSKSVLLPVYSINWKRGVRFTMRYNFYDWGISIEASKDVAWDFDRLCRPDSVGSCCEGFPEDRLFGPWSENHAKFTVSLYRDYDVYTFMYLLKRQFPAEVTRQRSVNPASTG